MRIEIWARFLFIAVLVVGAPALVGAAQSGKDDRVVKDGSVVSLQYTLSGEDGKTIESNKGKEPLKYTQGQRQIVPGLERQVAGMKVGVEKRVKVKPEDGYGKIDPNAYQEVPKEQIPAEGLKVGAVLGARSPEGQVIPVRVHQIKDQSVVLDFNHPMAGKTLVFDVKVLDIESAPAPQPKGPAQPPQPAAPAKPSQPAQPK
jgi:FKBP-type peptidyl-prolyl cis-trans isomerase SlyD